MDCKVGKLDDGTEMKSTRIKVWYDDGTVVELGRGKRSTTHRIDVRRGSYRWKFFSDKEPFSIGLAATAIRKIENEVLIPINAGTEMTGPRP